MAAGPGRGGRMSRPLRAAGLWPGCAGSGVHRGPASSAIACRPGHLGLPGQGRSRSWSRRSGPSSRPLPSMGRVTASSGQGCAWRASGPPAVRGAAAPARAPPARPVAGRLPARPARSRRHHHPRSAGQHVGHRHDQHLDGRGPGRGARRLTTPAPDASACRPVWLSRFEALEPLRRGLIHVRRLPG
jgi:hypothetical protein